ncbi:hypothetical protein [Pseudacidovorax sp. NFM-22]|uniref:hypothetical protein n=1 Tax=Pseudacidovorax sp. NFM-22 TaxID=2744469 RepID=UPI001F26DE4A|nr:hypothetical protein [Pseudacidovorax sp. NFM-22]
MKKHIIISVLIFSSTINAKEISVENISKNFFNQCRSEIEKTNKNCNVGCGMAYIQCYQGAEDLIASETSKLQAQIKNPACIAEVRKIIDAIDRLKSDLSSDTRFDSTGAAMEIKQHIEIMKYKSVASLLAECKR